MKLLLNNQEINPALPDRATLGSALLAAEGQIGEDEVIATIHVDGEPLTAELLSEWKNRPLDDFCEARIEAPKRKMLAGQGLRIIAQGLADSNDDRQVIAEHLCQGRTAEAMNLLPEYLKIWHSTPQSLACAVRLLQQDLDRLEIYNPQDDQPILVAEALAQLTELLGRVKSALEAGDLVMLSDILDYEFAPLADLWQHLLEQLADRFDNQN